MPPGLAYLWAILSHRDSENQTSDLRPQNVAPATRPPAMKQTSNSRNEIDATPNGQRDAPATSEVRHPKSDAAILCRAPQEPANAEVI